jgi:nucleotide-binding universal stress UspA family protein
MNLDKRLQVRALPLIKKVLVAVDGSENSDRALSLALDLAGKYGASVLLLNVFHMPPVYGYPDEPIAYQANASSFIRDLRKVHQKILSKAAKKAADLKPELRVSTELKEGDPPSQIVETASNGQFDVIVLGHRGWSRIRELFLGSTSERVAHLAQCAVLIVK